MADVFLMGTSGSFNDPNRSLWREPIKAECAKWGIECFDPVVPVWNEDYGKIEVEALQKAKVLVMAITSETAGVASLAESGWAVLSALMRRQHVGLYIAPDYQGEKSTRSTLMVRLEELINGNSGETIEEASRRARKLVNSHATNLLTQFPGLTVYLAKTLEELTTWTVATAKKVKAVPHK